MNQISSAGGVRGGIPESRPLALRYGMAAAFVALAWIGREAITPGIGPSSLPFIFFFPSIAAAAWFGGLGPAIFSLLLSASISNWYFFDRAEVPPAAIFDLTALMAFVVASLFIVAAMETMHRAQARLSQELSGRQRDQAELRHARDVLSITLASIGDGVIVTDQVGRITFLNSEAERLTRWTNAQAAGQPLPDVFHIINEESRRAVENPVEKVLRLGTVVGLANHTILISKDGTETPIDDSAAPIRQDGGPPLGVVLVFRDATEQRSALRARTRLAAIVEHSGDAICTKNLDGVIQTWNAGAERLFGYAEEEIIGKPVTTLIPEELLHEEAEILERLRRGQPYERLETIRLARDGRRIPVSLSVSPLKDEEGRVYGASKILSDISDVVAAREALAREREILATTLASIGDGVIVTDPAGRITFLNREAERMTQWTNSEAVGRPLIEVFRVINEETRKAVESPVEQVLQQGTVVGLANHTVLLAKDGSETPIDDSAAPIRGPSGPLMGVVLVFRDFTVRRNAEQVLQESARRKDEFLAILSHELRNPLAPIRMAVSMLQKNGPPVPELQELCDVISRQTSFLTRLLDDLLDVSRIASGKITLRRERVSLGLALSAAVESVRPFSEARDHRLSVCASPEPLYVEGDLARLAQIFTNLLNNACKYTERGGHIQLSMDREGHQAVVRVRDNGIGITSDQLPRIFEMFVQLDRSLDLSQGGLGVGLSLVRRLVEMHSGSIEARSDGLGKGSEFIVRLPALVGMGAASGPRPQPKAGAVKTKRRILVADDNVDSASLLARILRHEGHDVRTAHDGLAVIQEAAAFVPELAILDIGMPKLNGYEVARRIRSEFGNRMILVAVTGWGQEEDKRRALEAGFDHHLTKPVDPAVLDRLLFAVGVDQSSGGHAS